MWYRDPSLAPSRSLTLRLAILAAALVTGCEDDDHDSEEDPPPNILFILTDDHRADGCGAFGNGSIRTPNFDELAARGARFTALYTASPLCCPSRASLLTGLYPHQTGVLTNGLVDLQPGTQTIAHRLNQRGYVTGFVGKAHLRGNPSRWGFKEAPCVLRGGGSQYVNPSLVVNGRTRTVPGVITNTFADHAIKFIERHRKDRWFLWFSTNAPHGPYYHDPQFPYSASSIAPPPLWPPNQDLSDPRWPIYYSTISNLDRNVGRIVATLKKHGLFDNTLIFFVGDNGFMFGSHGYDAKQVWFEESARVPAIACWPRRIPAGVEISTPCVSIDFVATVLDVLGIPNPPCMEARSFLPAITEHQPLRSTAFSEVKAEDRYGGLWRMARSAGSKYVRFPQTGREKLYDLVADPHEHQNVASDPAYAVMLLQMRGEMTDWLARTP